MKQATHDMGGPKNTSPLLDPTTWLGRVVEFETIEGVRRRGLVSRVVSQVVESGGGIPYLLPFEFYFDDDLMDPIPVRQLVWVNTFTG